MGLDLGLEQAGWNCEFANENDSVACETIRSNRPQLNLNQGDIRKICCEDLPPNLDAFVGGPPCQAFSTAGRRLGLNDSRGNVFLHFLQLAVDYQVPTIVLENVRGMLSAPLFHRPHSERGLGFAPLSLQELKGGAFAHILDILNGSGYSVTFDLYDTANFGVPQRRERIVLLASRSITFPLLEATHSRAHSSLSAWISFRQAVAGVKKHTYSSLRPKQEEVIQHLLPGQNWRKLPERLQREAMGRAYECSGGRTGFYRRLSWDSPSPTLMTSPTMPATLLAHPVLNRPLSVEEYARIQTFPDSWSFAGTTAQQYRQIGNAVPVQFGKVIGLQILRCLNSKTNVDHTGVQTINSRYSNTNNKTWRAQLKDKT